MQQRRAQTGGVLPSASAMGVEIGRIRPTSVFERAGESRMTPPVRSISSQARPTQNAGTLAVMARRADSKTGLRLELEGQITLQRLGDAIDAWTDFLREVGRDVAGRGGRDAVRYVVTEAKGGSLTLGVRPQAAKRNVPAAVIPRIATTVTAGIRSLDRSAKRPRYFSDTALVKLRDLALLTDPETPTVKISNGTGVRISLSQRLVAHVEEVLTPEFTSIGTVEGRLEGLIIHGKARCLIYDPLTTRQVSCYFGGRIKWESVLRLFGKRVAATGVIKARRSGERVSIQATQLRPLQPDDEELPSVRDMLGILKTAT